MNRNPLLQTQRGVTLIVSLVLLLALTVVGIAGMKETVTQQKVINGTADDDVAFQAAEFALRAGEKFTADFVRDNGQMAAGDYKADESNHRQYGGDLNDAWWKSRTSTTWQGTGAGVASDYPLVGTAQQAPSFIVEKLGDDTNGGSVDVNSDDNRVVNYRVTARGNGVSPNSYVVLQSTYAVQY